MAFSGNLDGLRVNHAELDNAVAEMERIAKRIDAVLDDLVADLQPLVGQWDGETKRAFHELEKSWDFAMREMKDLLDRSKNTVYQSNREFQAADIRNAANFDF